MNSSRWLPVPTPAHKNVLTWLGGMSAACLLLGAGCDGGAAVDDGVGGGGAPGAGGTPATGGAATGGAGGEGGGGGEGGEVLSCESDEWLDPYDDTCESCTGFEDYTHLCEDFVDVVDDATNTNPLTAYDSATATLTLQLREGTPGIVSASGFVASYQEVGGASHTVNQELPATVEGSLVKVDFSALEPIEYVFGFELTVEDACGNETVIDTYRPSFYLSGEDYSVYCENF